ncbi:MAG: sensor histidine kinase [Candidatus Dormibacteraceae bacterium]
MLARIPRPDSGILDWALALLLLVVAEAEVWTTSVFRGPPLANAAFAGLGTLPLAWRVRRPFTVTVTLAFALAAQSFLLGGASSLSQVLAGLLASYSVARHADERKALIAAGAVAAALLVHGFASLTPLSGGDWLFTYVLTAGAWAAGRALRIREDHGRRLVERSTQLDRERELREMTAVADERLRIARELHDIVSHSVSMIVLQATGARRVMASNPSRATEALGHIEGLARAALSDMRSMVGVLRTPGAADSEPLPSGTLEDLVDQVRRSGMEIELHVTGEPVNGALGVAVYRIVQEALTNAVKHSGARSAAVAVAYGNGVEIEIRNEAGDRPAKSGSGEGHGLVGMRERVAVYGGSLEAAPEPGGGYRVVARLPAPDS